MNQINFKIGTFLSKKLYAIYFILESDSAKLIHCRKWPLYMYMYQIKFIYQFYIRSTFRNLCLLIYNVISSMEQFDLVSNKK